MLPPKHLIVFLLSALLLGHLVSAAESNSAIDDKDVRVERGGDNFTVDYKCTPPVSPVLAWDRSCRFLAHGRVIPNLTHSQMLKRSADSFRVRQKGSARYCLFSSDFEIGKAKAMAPDWSITPRCNPTSGYHR